MGQWAHDWTGEWRVGKSKQAFPDDTFVVEVDTLSADGFVSSRQLISKEQARRFKVLAENEAAIAATRSGKAT
jgi:hypothetical protein